MNGCGITCLDVFVNTMWLKSSSLCQVECSNLELVCLEQLVCLCGDNDWSSTVIIDHEDFERGDMCTPNLEGYGDD